MKKTLFFAFQKTIPVLFGYLFLGIAFGLLLQEAGFNWIWALCMSLFIFAGSIQFIAVGFLSAGTPLFTVAIMSLLINCRHIFYGLSFIDSFRSMGKKYPYMIFSLTDETYSLLCSCQYPEDIDKNQAMFYIALLDHAYWVIGSVLGAVMGQLITFDLTGIDFSMTALFVVIFVEQWRASNSPIFLL